MAMASGARAVVMVGGNGGGDGGGGDGGGDDGCGGEGVGCTDGNERGGGWACWECAATQMRVGRRA